MDLSAEDLVGLLKEAVWQQYLATLRAERAEARLTEEG